MAKTSADDIAKALRQHALCLEAERKQRVREKEDLQFQTPEGQWTEDAKKHRAATTIAGQLIPARPMLSIPTLDEPIQLLANQARAAHLGVNIHPLTEDATDDTAEVLQGLYRHIEVDSRASQARNWAYDRVLWCGTGVYRIDAVYDDDAGDPHDQKLVFKRIVYQASVHFDPYAQEQDKSDGEFAFVDADMRFSTYKRKYPKSKLSSYTDAEFTSLMDETPGWVSGAQEDQRTIRVSEHWQVKIETETIEGRERETRTVTWRVINCQEELEPEQLWDGIYIPLIFCLGRELQPFENDGDRRIVGMVHNAKDAARLVNWGASGVVEMAATEPKSPFIGVEGVFEGHERDFAEANIRNLPFLQYKRTGTDGMPAPPPERVQVDVSRMGPNLQLLSIGKNFVDIATSTYGPAKGENTPAHRSGRAIQELQDQTLASTTHYLDNLANISMMYESRVVLDLLPRKYDRPGRVAHILDENMKARPLILNAPFMPDPQTGRPVALPYGTPDEQAATNKLVADPKHPAKYYNLKKGRYGVSVTIGKTNASRLQEGQDAIGQVLQADPALMPIIGPEWMKFQDFPGAKSIATILEKVRAHQFPFLADQGQQNTAQQLAMAEATMKQMHAAIQDLQQKLDADVVKAQGQVQIAQLNADKEIALQQMKDATSIAVAKINALAKGVIADNEAQNEAMALAQTQQHEVGMAALDHATTTAQADQQHQQALEQSDLEHQQALTQGEQAQAHGLETQAAQPEPVDGGGGQT